MSIVDKRYFVEYRSDKIIAVSKTIVKRLTEIFNVDQKKITLVPNFVDSEEINFNQIISAPGDNSSAVNILSVGRFHKEKSFETLLEAVSLIKGTEIKITLIGEGEEEDHYRMIADRKKLDVRFIRPRRNLKEFFDMAHICILPSIVDPMPGFMLQSGLHCKPFIGSDVDGMREVIIEGTNGLLFEMRNAPELSEKIKLFINDKTIAQKCAENLKQLVLQNYTERSVIPQIANIYKSFKE